MFWRKKDKAKEQQEDAAKQEQQQPAPLLPEPEEGFGLGEDLAVLEGEQIDEIGRRVTYTYDASGNLLTRTELDTSTNAARTWTYTYNSFNKVLTEDGPRTDLSDITTYAYYTCTTGTECGQLHTATNALGHVTTYNTYNVHGQPLTITDPNGVVTTISPTSISNPDSSSTSRSAAEGSSSNDRAWSL